uniref:Envelope protein n=1 Tax=Parascaris univalens TaxID=6257 RepID=A0A915C620_PARUN
MKRERGVNDELITRLQRICEEYAFNGKQLKSNRQKRLVGASLALHAAQAAWNIKQDLDLRAVQNELKEQAEMLRSLKEATNDKNRFIQLTKRAEQRLSVVMQLESHLKEKKSAFLHSLELLFHTHRVHNELLSTTELLDIMKMLFGDDEFQQSAYSVHRYLTLFYVTVVPRSCDLTQNIIHSDVCAPFIAANELRTLYQTAKIARFINESRFFVLTDIPKYIATTVNRTTEAVILSDLCQRKGGYVYDCPMSQLDTSECEVNTLNNCVVHVRRVNGSFTHVQRLRDLFVVATNEKSFIIGNSTIWFHQKVYSPTFTLKVARNCIARIGSQVLIGNANTTSFLQHYQVPLQIYVDDLIMAEFDQLTESNEALIAKLNAHERKVTVAIAAFDKSLVEKAYDLILNSSFNTYLYIGIIATIVLCSLYFCCCRCGPICKPSNARRWYHHRVFTVRSASDCQHCCGDNV